MSDTPFVSPYLLRPLRSYEAVRRERVRQCAQQQPPETTRKEFARHKAETPPGGAGVAADAGGDRR